MRIFLHAYSHPAGYAYTQVLTQQQQQQKYTLTYMHVSIHVSTLSFALVHMCGSDHVHI